MYLILCIVTIVSVAILIVTLSRSEFALPEAPLQRTILQGQGGSTVWSNELPPIQAKLNGDNNPITNIAAPVNDTDAAQAGWTRRLVEQSTGSKPQGVPGSVQYYGANDDFAGSAAFTYNTSNGRLTSTTFSGRLEAGQQPGVTAIGVQDADMYMGGFSIRNVASVNGNLAGFVTETTQPLISTISSGNGLSVNNSPITGMSMRPTPGASDATTVQYVADAVANAGGGPGGGNNQYQFNDGNGGFVGTINLARFSNGVISMSEGLKVSGDVLSDSANIGVLNAGPINASTAILTGLTLQGAMNGTTATFSGAVSATGDMTGEKGSFTEVESTGPIEGTIATFTSVTAGAGAVSGGAATFTSVATGAGAVSGGEATFTSVNAGVGAVNGGAATFTSMNAVSGAVSGGTATFTSTNGGAGTFTSVDGDAATFTSVNAGTGNVSGGAATFTSVNAGTGMIRGGDTTLTSGNVFTNLYVHQQLGATDILTTNTITTTNLVSDGKVSSVTGIFTLVVTAPLLKSSGEVAGVTGNFSGEVAAASIAASGEVAGSSGTFTNTVTAGEVSAVDATISGNVSVAANLDVANVSVSEELKITNLTITPFPNGVGTRFSYVSDVMFLKIDEVIFRQPIYCEVGTSVISSLRIDSNLYMPNKIGIQFNNPTDNPNGITLEYDTDALYLRTDTSNSLVAKPGGTTEMWGESDSTGKGMKTTWDNAWTVSRGNLVGSDADFNFLSIDYDAGNVSGNVRRSGQNTEYPWLRVTNKDTNLYSSGELFLTSNIVSGATDIYGKDHMILKVGDGDTESNITLSDISSVKYGYGLRTYARGNIAFTSDGVSTSLYASSRTLLSGGYNFTHLYAGSNQCFRATNTTTDIYAANEKVFEADGNDMKMLANNKQILSSVGTVTSLSTDGNPFIYCDSSNEDVVIQAASSAEYQARFVVFNTTIGVEADARPASSHVFTVRHNGAGIGLYGNTYSWQSYYMNGDHATQYRLAGRTGVYYAYPNDFMVRAEQIATTDANVYLDANLILSSTQADVKLIVPNGKVVMDTDMIPVSNLTSDIGTPTLLYHNMYAENFLNTSDERLKSNVEPLSNALPFVRAVASKTFEMHGDPHAGYLAQQVVEEMDAQPVPVALVHIDYKTADLCENEPCTCEVCGDCGCSSCVDHVSVHDNDECDCLCHAQYSLDYSKMTPFLSSAIKTVDDRVLALEAENASLKATLADVLARLETLENTA